MPFLEKVQLVRARKGISELIATVVMIGLMALVGTAALLYSMNYFSGVTSAREGAENIELSSMKEDFVIVDAISKGGQASVAVYNFGEAEIFIVGMYVNGISYNLTTPPVEIRAGETAWVNASGATDTANLALIRVVSSTGNFYENVFKR